MKIKQLHLQNYGRFEDLTVDFAPNGERSGNVTVIVGNNGAGKSQILQALATGLSWFVNGIRNEMDGFEIDKKFIKNGKNDVLVELKADFGEYNFQNHFDENKYTHWQFMNVHDGRDSSFDKNTKQLKSFISKYRKKLTNDNSSSLPLIVFYSVHRSILKETEAHFLMNSYSQFDGYSKSLEIAEIDFDEFVKWFRSLDDEYLQLSNDSLKKLSQDDTREVQISLEQIAFFEKHLNNLERQMKLFDSQKNLLERLGETENPFESEFGEMKELKKELDEQKTVLEKILSSTKTNSSIQISVKKSVGKAITDFTDFQNLRIERQGIPTMIVEKDGQELDVNQLSQGEKSLLALVGDIARRLAILNPSLDDPLQGEGVVMIDEVDLHLHPKWQHNLIDKLVKTFPKVQFILTTHSPLIVSDRQDILVYILDNGELQTVGNIYGEDANTVLTKVFDTDYRDSDVQQQFNRIYQLISEKNFAQAEQAIIDLEQELPTHNLELLRLRLHLTQAQLAETQGA